ncbi:MAG TPA: carboxypeptidase regulatory-like domain-containing protein [Candidatus Hydrogenedentes bacterium]|jgi:protocatechuate 3,4-dioxygenase beta subunit|nr:carboxypeptidase regulatory-like domain-containing protein [Candidatus Hydrogenedentota bacterium]HPJ98286.1 carboxypeptidase regulatory-like domain-containing protein [Candidatus Hydrogenedentota bacterium]
MNPKDSERLSRYLDGELTPTELREVESLLATSLEAREEYAVMKQVHKSVRDILPETRFSRPELAAPRRRSLHWLAAAAAIVVLFGGLMFGVQVYHGSFKEPAAPPTSAAPSPVSPVAPAPGTLAGSPAPSTGAPAMPATPGMEADASEAEHPSASFLKGVVTNSQNEPIPGASVRALAWLDPSPPYGLDGDPLLASVHTDGGGRFLLDWPSEARAVAIEARGYAPRHWHYSGGVLASALELHAQLQPEEPDTGRVVDSTGAPLAGVRVAAQSACDPAQAAVTGADGVYRVSSWQGMGPLFFSHPDFALSWTKPDASEATETVLEPGGALRLCVVQNGQPVPGAMVQMVAEIPNALGYALRREADEAGCVEFEQLPTDPAALENFAVVATAPNGVKARLEEVPAIRAGATAECVLTVPDSYPGKVAGTVKDTEGNPLAGVAVVARSRGAVSQCIRTDENGAYTIGLPLGDTRISMAWDFLGPGQDVLEPGRNVLQVNKAGTTFTQDFTLETSVKDITFVRTDGAPVEDLWLQLEPGLPRDYDRSARWRVAASAGHIQVLCKSIERGVAYDPVGEYAATWSMPEDQAQATVVFDLPVGALTGRIIDTAGQPLRGASLYARGSTQDYRFEQAWSGAEGAFRIEPLSLDGTYDLYIYLDGYQPLPGSHLTGLRAAKEAAPLEIVMAPRDAGVSGQVLASDGSPLYHAHLFLTDSERTGHHASTGQDGAFSFEVAKGVYTLWAIAPALDATTSVTVEAPSHDTVITLPVAASPPPVADVAPPHDPASEKAVNDMKQLGLVFKMFANEAPGEFFPALEPQPGVLAPEWNAIYPEYLVDTRIMNTQEGVTRCYFAHALTGEAAGLAFLDALQQLGIEAIRDQDIQVGPGKGSAGGDVILRLHEGFESRLLTEVPPNVSGYLVQAATPVLWEVPGGREESGGWVMYMDGRVEWVPYPGPFPMTEAFVTRTRDVLGLGR